MTLPHTPLQRATAPPDPKELQAVFSSQPMQRVLSEAAWAARIILQADASVVFLRQTNQPQLAAAAWHGREAEETSLPVESPYVQALWGARRFISWMTADDCSDPAFVAVLESMGLNSGIVLPTKAGGEMIGVWLVGSVGPRAFGENDSRIIQTLADNIELSIESMLLTLENMRYRREADALYEIGKEISQLMDLDRVLEVIVKKTRSLMNAELSYLALADDEARQVRVRITDGTRHNALGTMVLNYGEGVGGYVALHRVPLLVHNYVRDSPKPPGVAYLAATEDILSIISVPMVTRSGLVGVLFAASRQEAAFNDSQMDLLAALGTQAAIAIENARLYENEKSIAQKLRDATETGEQLLHLVLNNQGFSAITTTLSHLVRAPVLVEDDLHRVVATSSEGALGPEGQSLPHLTCSTDDLWHDLEFGEAIHTLQHERRAIHVPARPDRKVYFPRTIAPVVAGAEILGYVSALELDSFSEQQYAAVDQASIILALEFLKGEIAQDVEARLAGDLLDDLIQARAASDPMLMQRAARLNIDLRQPYRILVLDIDQFAQAVRRHHWTDMDALSLKRRFLGIVTDIVRNDIKGALTGTRSDSVLVLLPAPENASLRQAEMQAQALQSALIGTLADLTVSVGIGRAAQEPGLLPRSYEDAMLALKTVSQFGGQARVVAFETLGVVPLLLQSQNQKELMAFMEQYLGPLVRYDSTNQSQLLDTLDCYLANNGNLRLTAEGCHVHLNSLKYRLRRIEEICGLDLRDGDLRFRAQLALAIHRAVGLTTG